MVWRVSGREPLRLSCEGARIVLAEAASVTSLVHANDQRQEEGEGSRNWAVLLVLLVPPATALTVLAAFL